MGVTRRLSGGNPQIAKGDGDAPVQAYIAAMPGWKRAVGKRLDALIVLNVPTVRKHKDVRYFDIYEGDELDETLMTTWLKQVAALPGWDVSRQK